MKEQLTTVMEETKDGEIRERILIDLTIGDIEADSVSGLAYVSRKPLEQHIRLNLHHNLWDDTMLVK
jgi:hypothetical protein